MTQWIKCPHCQGEEGWFVVRDWSDCPGCEGQGGYIGNATLKSNQEAQDPKKGTDDDSSTK